LLYRNGRGIVLSEVGKLLESYAHSVVKLVGQARSEIDAMRLMPQGCVATAMPPSIGWVLTGPLVVQCRKAFPNIAMHVVEGFSGQWPNGCQPAGSISVSSIRHPASRRWRRNRCSPTN